MKKLYVMYSKKLVLHKVGMSIDPKLRENQLRSAHSKDIELIYQTDFLENASEVEKMAHNILDLFRAEGREWFICGRNQAIDAVNKSVESIGVVNKDFNPDDVKFRHMIGNAYKFAYLAKNIDKILFSLVSGCKIVFRHPAFYGYEFQIVAKKKEVK